MRRKDPRQVDYSSPSGTPTQSGDGGAVKTKGEVLKAPVEAVTHPWSNYIAELTENRLVLAVFYAEFDVHEGPRIFFQSPTNFISDEMFTSISEYVIPKKNLGSKFTTVRVGPHVVMGFPMRIDDTIYERNLFSFNVCVVVKHRIGAEMVLEQPLRKLGSHLRMVEEETKFLSRPESKERMGAVVEQLYLDLNAKGQSVVKIDNANAIHLSLHFCATPPSPILSHHVPVCVVPNLVESLGGPESDLSIRAIVPHIDGVRSVVAISHAANMDLEVTKSALQNLMYFELVVVIDVFQFSNVYCLIPHKLQPFIQNIMNNPHPDTKEQTLRYLTFDSKPLPPLNDVLSIILSFQHGRSVADVYMLHEGKLGVINMRRLVTFALVNGIIRRIHEFVLPAQPFQEFRDPNLLKLPPMALEMIKTGKHCYDEFCSLLMCGKSDLDSLFRSSSEVSILMR